MRARVRFVGRGLVRMRLCWGIGHVFAWAGNRITAEGLPGGVGGGGEDREGV